MVTLTALAGPAHPGNPRGRTPARLPAERRRDGGHHAEHLAPEIELATMADGRPALQLARLAETKKAIARTVIKAPQWKAALAVSGRLAAGDRRAASPRKPRDDAEEELARQEKAAALEVLATSRISVLDRRRWHRQDHAA